MTKKPPAGYVGWNEQTFQRLIAATPETLRPRLRITHSMVLAEVEQGGDARARVLRLIEDSMQSPEEKAALATRTEEVLATLIDAGVVERVSVEGGGEAYSTTVELPDNFALDQPLAPFLLAALELLDPEDDAYALDLISMVEATLENPPQILRAQEREARDKAMAEMKAEGIDYDERIERIQEVSYPMPLEELLSEAFERYVAKVPWAADYELRCKSVLRDMVETAADFKGYVQRLGIARSEGTLLRYLSDAYRSLSRTVPADKLDERLLNVVAWLGMVVRTVDSSLVDEWAGTTTDEIDAGTAPAAADVVVQDRRAVTLLVRNALFARVRLIATSDVNALGELDEGWGWRAPRWRQAIEAFYDAHDEVLLDGDARSWDFLTIDDTDEGTEHVWHVRQMLKDADGDRDFGIAADVDLDATQEEGEAIFKNYRVGFAEEVLGP